MRVQIIGAGRVGAPLGAWLMDKRIHVSFVDINEELLHDVVNGTLDWQEPYLNETLKDEAEYIVTDSNQPIDWAFICVGSPVDDNGIAQLDHVDKIIADIPKSVNIVLRSTVPPGTADRLSEKFGRTIWHAPERLLLGNGMTELNELPQIVGCTGPDFAIRNYEFGAAFAECFPSYIYGKAIEAECAKVANNIVRYIEFATGTELSQLFQVTGADNKVVRQMMTEGYKRGRIAFPSFVGSYCLDKDWQMLQAVTGYIPTMAKAAADYNTRLIERLIQQDLLLFMPNNFENKNITILGMTYKPNLDDCRQSPFFGIYDAVNCRTPNKIYVHDPLVQVDETFAELSPFTNIEKLVIGNSAQAMVSKSDLVILATAHDDYLYDTLELKEGTIVIDPSGMLSTKHSEFVWEVE